MTANRRSAAVILLLVCALMAGASSARAQAARQARLIVTVVDTTSAVIQGATVRVVGLDETTSKLTVEPVKSSEKGIAVFERLPLGRYSIQGEFPGFQMGLLRDLRLKAGDNKHVLVLPLEKFSDEVTVGRDKLTSASDRAGTFGTALTREQVDALSDDPTEMARQLNDMAGPGATIRVDSFEGQQLPPKAQIKAVHITRDMFAAETHGAGGMFIDIITQPGIGPLAGQTRFGFYDSTLDGTNPLIGANGPAQNRSLSANIRGSLKKETSSFSLSMGGSDNYSTASLYAVVPGGKRAEVMDVRSPSGTFSLSGLFDYAITKDQTIRVTFSRYTSSYDNQGIGGYNLEERAYSTDSANYNVRFQEAGPLGRRFFINTRFAMTGSDRESRSALEAPTIVVTDAFTAGGAQRAGGEHSRLLVLNSDLDYVRGINSWRFGVQVEAAHYRSDAASNYLGTYTFESLAAYEAGLPLAFTRRLGDPTVAYWNVQAGVYAQDDIRVNKRLTLSPGVRFEAQTHVNDWSNLAPRFGVTWAPFKGGKTTLRVSAGIFNDWLSTGIYEQTLRVDGLHQQELNIMNPGYPNPGNVGVVPPTNVYLLGDTVGMGHSKRVSGGIDQKITKTISVGATYANTRGTDLLVGHNLNAPIAGVRPDPLYANIIETMPAGSSRTHSLSIYGNTSLTPMMPGSTTAGPLLNWKRGLGVYASYNVARSENNTNGAWSVPASDTLATEWGPSPGDVRHRAFLSLNSQAIKNLSASVSFRVYSGSPFTIITGVDNNGDLILNDRPAGVGRNTARARMQSYSDGYFSYTIGFGKRKVPMGPGIMISGGGVGGISVSSVTQPNAPRYRLTLTAMISNLLNHGNYVGYVGNMRSPLFLQPTDVEGVRTMNFGMMFSF